MVYTKTIKKINNPCDAEENSYDAVILFTGRKGGIHSNNSEVVGDLMDVHASEK